MKKKPRSKRTTSSAASSRSPQRVPETELRIIGGKLKGSRIRYSGDRCVRPMKDRVREALFNLVGPSIRDTHVIDLFAGTGALAFESLSRGAARATILERHFPTAKIVRENAKQLNVADCVEILTVDTFIWVRLANKQSNSKTQSLVTQGSLPDQTMHAKPTSDLTQVQFPSAVRPWLVLCSPPYKFFTERAEEMDTLIGTLIDVAPAKSTFVVEATDEWDWVRMPLPDDWDVRTYHPAVLGMYRKP